MARGCEALRSAKLVDLVGERGALDDPLRRALHQVEPLVALVTGFEPWCGVDRGSANSFRGVEPPVVLSEHHGAIVGLEGHTYIEGARAFRTDGQPVGRSRALLLRSYAVALHL